ncbi:MAG: sulfotransferase [Candidatus Rokubacteria bacterium]|nr:sulfotransferase [Candidatus Rokubacteria bacterium]
MPTEARPVFVVGCPRSGTRLLATILGAHSRGIAVPDSRFITEALAAVADPASSRARVLADPRLGTFGIDVDAVRRDLATADGSHADLWRLLVRRYAEATGCPAARVWIDPTPVHARHATMLVDLFPRARFVHLVRDGRAVAASVMPLSWGPNTAMRAARWWSEHLAFGLGLELWGGPRVMRVRYEDALANPHRTIPAVSAFAGLEYEPAMLAGATAPQRDRGDAWEERLSARDVEIFESAAGDLLRYLGYPMRFAGHARPPSAGERAAAAVRGRLRALLAAATQRMRFGSASAE